MAKITIVDGIPFVSVTLFANGKTLQLDRVLLDTGSEGTLFKTDDLRNIDVLLSLDDTVVLLSGIGGTEAVVQKDIDELHVGELSLKNFTIQMGNVSYGFEMDGILGLDFLLQTQAILDFDRLEIRKA